MLSMGMNDRWGNDVHKYKMGISPLHFFQEGQEALEEAPG